MLFDVHMFIPLTAAGLVVGWCARHGLVSSALTGRFAGNYPATASLLLVKRDPRAMFPSMQPDATQLSIRGQQESGSERLNS